MLLDSVNEAIERGWNIPSCDWSVMADFYLEMWTVYERPTDYPEGYIARKFLIKPTGPEATNIAYKADDLNELRRWLARSGLIGPLPRDENDEPQIVETWT